MKNSGAAYGEKVVQAFRGMESRTIQKWEQDGWKLVGREEGKLRTTLTFHKPKPEPSKKNVMLTAGAGVILTAVVITGVISEDGEGEPPEEITSAAADSAEQPTIKEETGAPMEGRESDELITATSHPDFAALLHESDYCGEPVADFADQYAGRSIQFDGHLATMDPAGFDSPRYNLLLSPGDSIPGGNPSGPAFSYRDMNPPVDLKFGDGGAPDPLEVGQNFTFTAQMEKFDEKSCLFILDPIKTEMREVAPPVLEEEVISEERVPEELAVIPEEIPAPVPAPAPIPASVSYGSCADVRAAGAAPIYQGQPGYSRKLDRDGDGIACE